MIAVSSSDAVNLSVALLAHRLNPQARTVVRTFDAAAFEQDRFRREAMQLRRMQIKSATAGATKEGPLRHNAVETFVEKNTGTNTGTKIPWLDWEIVPEDDGITIDAYMAGIARDELSSENLAYLALRAYASR